MISYKLCILYYIISLLCTFFIEIPIVYFLFNKIDILNRRKILLSSFLSQLITHPFFFGLTPIIIYAFQSDSPSFITVLDNIYIKEMIIPITEGVFYLFYLKPHRWYYAFVFSYIANFLSWGIGYCIPYKFIKDLILN